MADVARRAAPAIGCVVEVEVEGGRVTRVGLLAPDVGSPEAPPSAGRPAPGTLPGATLADVVARRLVALTEGARDALDDVPVDWSRVTGFRRVVLEALRGVGPGESTTYGALAARVGKGPGAARAVGGAMAANPWPLLVPCHRVLPEGGRLGSYSGYGGVRTKERLLAIERGTRPTEQARLP